MDQKNTTDTNVPSDVPVSPNSIKPNNPNDKSHLILTLIVVAACVVVLIVVSGSLLLFQTRATETKPVLVTTSNNVSEAPELPDVTEIDNTPSTTVPTDNKFSFFNPKKVGLVIFNDLSPEENALDVASVKTYLVGESSDSKVYVVSVPAAGPSFFIPYYYYVSAPSGEFLIIKKGDEDSFDSWTYNAVVKNIKPGIELVDSYEGIPAFPELFTASSNSFGTPSAFLDLTNEMDKDGGENSFVTKVNGFDLYKRYSQLSVYDQKDDKPVVVPGMFARQTYTVQPETKFGKFYSLNVDVLSDNSVPLVAWLDGKRSKEDMYSNASDICGGFSFGYNVIKGDVLNVDDLKYVGDLLYVGDAKTAQKVYQIDDADSVILKAFYTDYLTGRDYEGNKEKVLSYEEFVKTPNHFLYKDTLGDWIIYKNEVFSRLAECGKPVIYLYPEQTTNVSVKVGAEIRISDPIYNNGWEVIAEPSGNLTVNGNKYSSLFWEGQGNGDYPYVDEHGVVVKRSDVESVLWKHLSLLGLNQKESADFMEFWLPKMPDSNYVRLSWLGTNEMNELAPLSVTPKPDTMIRVFLDFEGMDKYKSLKPQNLSAVKRNGFTLVEWGGLLR